jgi:transposase
MSRKATPLACTETEQLLLEKIRDQASTPQKMSLRARIVLACAAGTPRNAIARSEKVTVNTVRHWAEAFSKKGLLGLHDRPRSGRKPHHGMKLRERVLLELEKPPPKGQSTWDGRALARLLHVSPHAVWRVLRAEGIALQRQRSWCVSTDKDFAAKAADIIALYLAPPQNVLVLCVDEKPSMQALERARGYVQTSSGKIVQGMKSTYRRHGTLNLFSALEVATGHIKASTTATKTRADFLAFMDTVVAEYPKDRELHVILDNYCTHKKVDAWLAAHPQVHFHYTPTSASWLNLVEVWFCLLSRKVLRQGSFTSTDNLRQAIEDFITVYSQNPTPFQWRKREVRGSQLRNTIINLCN